MVDDAPVTTTPSVFDPYGEGVGGDRMGAGPEASGPQQRVGPSAFDDHHPPSEHRIDDCVHCGFCLPTCPTYQLWGEEMDSPRGRIYLMKLGREGAIGIDDTMVGHMDACLGCMACVTACPSGVKYDELIEATRSQIERHHTRTPSDRAFRRLIFELFPRPGRLRVAAVGAWLYQRLRLGAVLRSSGLYDRLPHRLRALEGLLPEVSLRAVASRPPALTRAVGPRRRRVGMVTGCVQRVFFDDVNAATTRVLAAEGCDVVAPSTQGCCGALMVHAGHEEDALERARALIDTFEGTDVDTVVINAAGCGSTLKEYGHLLRDDPAYAERAAAFAAKVRDVSELLCELEPRAERHELRPGAGAGRPVRVAYHDACHLAHAQGVRRQPRDLLTAIPGVELVPIADPENCCGSAGIYNLVQPEPAEELGRRKAEHIAAAGADLVATGNPGCTMQIRRHLPGASAHAPVPVLHPVQLIDAALRGVPPPGLTATTTTMNEEPLR